MASSSGINIIGVSSSDISIQGDTGCFLHLQFLCCCAWISLPVYFGRLVSTGCSYCIAMYVYMDNWN
ncbi:hypothetical protein E2562_034179 [Oryza meyeriana var. granulata]|uniref:Uncharacterized protein n=1 Tax=Oryza meyeriana var. granulata TaxID=110450 RepID=A0A6G1ESC8_9ORYZ|nr:hypothetical protein E2562_034179 [Oryza meyeriana var. granulata]